MLMWWAPLAEPGVPAESGLTQPEATVIAAIIAVVAAAIAYAGVTKTVRNTRRETRRKEKLDLLVEGLLSVRNYTAEIMRITKTTPTDRVATIEKLDAGPMSEKFDAWALAHTKLSLYGFVDVAKSLQQMGTLVRDSWVAVRADPSYEIDGNAIDTQFSATTDAFRKAMRALK